MSRGLFFPGMKCPGYCGVCPAFQISGQEVSFSDNTITCRTTLICLAAQKETGLRSDRKPSWCPAREVEVEEDG